MDRAASCYLNGVSVKISEKYRPPRRTTLPPGLNHFEPPTHLFNENVSLIKQSEEALALIALMRNRRTEEKFQRKQRIPPEEKTNEDKETEEIKNGISLPIPDAGVSIIPKPQSVPTGFLPHAPATMAVLTPIPSSNVGKTKKEDTSTINLSEFESYSTNPFEEMELKTLNDKEELAMLLQPNQPNYVLPYQNFNAAWGVGLTETYSPVQHCPPNWTPHSSQAFEQQMEKLVMYENPTSPSFGSCLRQAKSVPDLSEAGDQTNPPKLNSKTPPPRLMSDEMRKPVSHRIPQVSHGDELSTAGNRLVQQLGDMGFRRERASKAVYRLGANEKNVVDQLLIIQRFEDLGYKIPQIESALELLKPGTAEMHQQLEQHLKMSTQLLALGFSQDKINSALIATGYDRDKALDILLMQ